MYILATTTTYQKNTKYYTKSGNTYTLLVEGTDYTVGDTITGTKYQATEYDKLYIRPYGSSSPYQEFPYKIDGVNTLPEFDGAANDVDIDAYTNTAGYTVRNRVRHDVATLEFNVPTMTGDELHSLFNMTANVWLDCLFFYESAWSFVSKKMYRHATVKYHKYYVDSADPAKNMYTNVNWGFVEE